MQTCEKGSFNALVKTHLGQALPKELGEAISMAEEPDESRQFIYRFFPLMKEARYPATDITPIFIRWLSSIKNMLPRAWGGCIPPITLPRRHHKLDLYIKGMNRFDEKNRPTFLDLGCGFPPVTTGDTAKQLPLWQVKGVDRSFPFYILYTQEGYYACFNEAGEFQYFQSFGPPAGRSLIQDPEKTRRYFNELFSTMNPKSGPKGFPENRTIEKNGCRLIRDHVKDFETENLSFIQADISDTGLPEADVIRCMNVHVYFPEPVRQEMTARSGKLLKDSGIMITGTNGLSIQSRYWVHKKNGRNLDCREFAFSPDNLSPFCFMAWFTLHDKDPESRLLSRLMGVIRSDRAFQKEFYRTLDQYLEDHEVCRRRSDGFLQMMSEEMPQAEYIRKNAVIWQQMDRDGFIDQAVTVLENSGYQAWKNHVGDIAVHPLSGPGAEPLSSGADS
ncbi:MAG: class I SAM-dependent methyltransferase [Desulfobacterales bacterium]|nr:class I SAM-dependent methyltransferase [Desulfobacterales bacterium]